MVAHATVSYATIISKAFLNVNKNGAAKKISQLRRLII